jgi:serine/threonine protein phosphatase PrpC
MNTMPENSTPSSRPVGIYLGDREAPFGADHPDYCAGYAVMGRYEVVFGSAIGSSHLASRHSKQSQRTHRDDAVAVGILPLNADTAAAMPEAPTQGEARRSAASDCWLVVAVADGVGSKEFSRYGAALCVERSVRHVLLELGGSPDRLNRPGSADPTIGTLFWSDSAIASGGASESKDRFQHPRTFAYDRSQEPSERPLPDLSPPPTASSPQSGEELQTILHNGFLASRERLIAYADAAGLAPDQLSCTLQMLALNTRSGLLAAAILGDGLISARWSFAFRDVVKPKSAGESGVVCPLHRSDWERYYATQALPAHIGLSLSTFHVMTDGIADDCMGASSFGPWTQHVEATLRRQSRLRDQTQSPHTWACEMMNWLIDNTRSDDDLTLALIFRNVAPEAGPPATNKRSQEEMVTDWHPIKGAQP